MRKAKGMIGKVDGVHTGGTINPKHTMHMPPL